MNKNISLSVFILSILLTVLVVFMTTYVALSEVFRDKYGELAKDLSQGSGTVIADSNMTPDDKLDIIKSLFQLYSYYDLDDDALTDGALKGLAQGTGDRYAEYYTEEEFSAMTDDSNGDMQGIGISIIHNTEYNVIEIINVFENSPAYEAGLEPGFLITYVGVGDDATPVSELGYTNAVFALQGEAGTLCEFTVNCGDDYAEVREYSIERGFVKEQTVTYRICETDKTVGIIKIMEFDATTPNQFFAAIDALKANGAEKLVFDVRYNPGGNLTSICEILDYLVPAGPIIRIKDKNGNEESIDSDENELNMPMAVLCNSSTASAAELFTSALMDYDKAVSVGNLTYGKGSMQTTIPLTDGSGIKLTTKMYFPPFSEGYDGIGITPDIEIDMDESTQGINIYKITDAQDTQLQRAVQYLNEGK